jgi:hypothetical protein
MAGRKRFTIYDAMEESGYFERNTCNIGARNSEGLPAYEKAEYPKMLYHPEGATVVVQQGEMIATPFGPKIVGERRELVSRVVKSEAEEKEALSTGWHLSPESSSRAGQGLAPLPAVTPAAMASLQDEITRLTAELEKAKGQQLASASQATPGTIIPARRPPAAGAAPLTKFD